MRMFSTIAVTVLLGMTACTASPRTASTPMAPASIGGSAAAPQSANSLPRGDVVNAPRAAPTGTVSTTVTPRTY